MRRHLKHCSCAPLLLFLIGWASCSPSSIEPLPDDSCSEVLITDTPGDSLQSDAFDLKAITINADSLVVEIAHGGGCKQHACALFMSPGVFLESFPAQANLYFQHDANGDRCKAMLRQKICFDLRPVAQLYQKFYQRNDPIQINVYGYLKGQSGQKLSATYRPR